MLSLCTNEEMHSLSLWLYQDQQNSLGKSFKCDHIAYLEYNKFKIISIKKKSVCAFKYNCSRIIILERLLFILLLLLLLLFLLLHYSYF